MKQKRFTDEQIVSILAQAERGEKTIGEVCRAHGVSAVSFYPWRQKFGSVGVKEVQRLRELEKENARLKRLLAERDLEIDACKELLAKNWEVLPSDGKACGFWWRGNSPSVRRVPCCTFLLPVCALGFAQRVVRRTKCLGSTSRNLLIKSCERVPEVRGSTCAVKETSSTTNGWVGCGDKRACLCGIAPNAASAPSPKANLLRGRRCIRCTGKWF